MSNRSSSKTSSTRGPKTPLSVITKYYNRSSVKASEQHHGTSCRRRSVDKLGSAYTKPREREPQATSKHSRHTLDSTVSQDSLSENTLQQMSKKFDRLSESIIELATSPRSVRVQSVESLLTKEFQTSLSTELNDPKFCQRFYQSTRDLVEKLLHVYEEGKINPRLIKGPSRNKFVKANSATSVCYKDQYLKEAIMNVLQSMCSNDVQEQVPPPPDVSLRGTATRERIRILRDMVRVEAGLEPELFQELDQRLEDLRRSLSQKRLEILGATLEDRDISVHRIERSSSSCVAIPPAAKTALMKNYKMCDTKSECEKGSNKNNSFKGFRNLEQKNSSELSKNFLVILENFGLDFCDDDILKRKAPDPIGEIRKRIKELVEKEILKRNDFLKRSTLSSKVSTESSLASSTESWVSRIDTDCGEEDEIGDEETRASFIEQDNNCDSKISGSIMSNPVIERIDESEMDLIKEDMNSTYGVERNKASEEDEEVDNRKDLDTVDEDALTTAVKYTLERERPKSVMTLSCENNEGDKQSFLAHVKSKWSSDESIAEIIFNEMKLAFDNFGKQVMHHGKSEVITTDLFGSKEEEIKLSSKTIRNVFELTAEQATKALIKIITKTNELISLLNETEPKISAQQKINPCEVLMVLKNCIGNPYESDSSDKFSGLKEDQHFSSTVAKACTVFTYLVNTLDCTPPRLKNHPLSILSPPQSMMRVLAILGSSEYFKDCFIYVESETRWNNNDKDMISKSSSNQSKTSQANIENKFGSYTNVEEIVKAFDLNKQISSMEILPELIHDFQPSIYKTNYENSKEKLGNSEHNLDLPASTITVQNVSDMFLHISTVLNNVPHRIKSEKILSLNPPFTFRKILDILYSDGDPNDVDKEGSFASLTVQNVSNFFLTLSKTFQDTPARVKNSNILDLGPPESLLKAIQLLVFLPYNSILASEQ